jgi:carbonic anhydrase
VIVPSGFAHAAGAHPGHATHRGYQGAIGPDGWTKLKPEFSACADKDGNLAVVSVVFDLEPANPAVGAAWGQMPKAEGKASLPTATKAITHGPFTEATS